LGGLSCCLSCWIIPLLRKSSSRSPRSAKAQFELVIEKGFRYLQSSSRILGLALASLTYLTYKSPNARIHAQWRFWATALGILLPLAPYEIYFIFPTNCRIIDIGKELRNREKDELDGGGSEEFESLLTKWQWRNGVRFVIPIMAAVI
ncbi:hypothetical protein EJ08DRAFT_566817, partial [Tothia fuscella]